MSITVEIADRMYDYTDEECASDAVARFQEERGLSDEATLKIWHGERNSDRSDLERRIFDAVDANGSVRRAEESVPGGVELSIG